MELKVKSSRSELKENLLANNLELALKWAMSHLQIIMGAAGVLLVAVLISSVYIIRQGETREKNWIRLAQAQSLLRQKNFDTTRQILMDVKKSAPASKEALFATYYLGEIGIEEKKYDEAVQNYSEVVAKAGKNPLKPLALSALGFTYEEKKDFPNAVQTYRQFMSAFAEHFLAARNQLSLGRVLLKAGETEAAKETLGQLVDLYPTSPWAENARQIMDKLASH